MKLTRFAAMSQSYDEDLLRPSQGDFVGSDDRALPIIFRPPYNKPDIRLTPFESRDLNFESPERESNELDMKLKKFFAGDYIFFPRSIHLIIALLKYLKIGPDEELAIRKTFNNGYISSCVTSPIEHVCKWSTDISNKTRAILVIHEFGFPCEEALKLKEEAESLGIPLIEDCAWTMGAKHAGTELGKIGDYSFYSLPKIFPMQYGAILRAGKLFDKKSQNLSEGTEAGKEELIRRCLAYYLPTLEESNEKRRMNWIYLASLLGKIGFRPLNDLREGVYPACLIVRTDDYGPWHDRLEDFGVESGRYYHEKAIFLPVHQNLSRVHLDYIFAVINGFLKGRSS